MFPKDGPPSNVEATDSETVASLLDPSYGIPPDIHFEIEFPVENNTLRMLDFTVTIDDEIMSIQTK